MKILQLLMGLTAPVTRKTYLISGLTLGILKYIGDGTLVYFATGKLWAPWSYLAPLLFIRSEAIGPAPEWVLWVLAFTTIPFCWIGLSMSVRRAADAGHYPWLGVLFVIPIVQYATIIGLSLAPTKGVWEKDERVKLPLSLTVAMMSIVIGVGVMLSMTSISVYVLRDYGSALFLGTPFMVGVVAGFLYNRAGDRGLGPTLGVASMSIIISGASILLFALEGLICILMAAVPAMIVCLFGAALSYAITNRYVKRLPPPGDRDEDGTNGNSQAKQLIGLVLMLPVLAGAESTLSGEREYEVISSVEINASPMETWDAVIHFSDLPPVDDWVLKTGIAYPIRAKLVGEGVGAVRYCEFSTGPFVEPITRWEPGKRLSFDVQSQPDPMTEMSPYRYIHPPHLDSYFRSNRGEFRFVDLGNGRTRLEGSTWYTIDIAPTVYWSALSDALLHRIHLRVLNHVKVTAEN